MKKEVIFLFAVFLISCEKAKKVDEVNLFEVVVLSQADTLPADTFYLAKIYFKNMDLLKERGYSIDGFYVDNHQIPVFAENIGTLMFRVQECYSNKPVENNIQKKNMNGTIKMKTSAGNDTTVNFPVEYFSVCNKIISL